MKGYSLSRVAQFVRYHYVSHSKNYLSLFLVIVALPVLFGILSRDMETVADMSMAIYLFGGVAYALRTTYAMRYRGTKVMDAVVPISNEERFTSMLINLMVIYPVVMILSSTVAMLIVWPFSYTQDFVATFVRMVSDYYFDWAIYVLIQIICSASLLINLAARRSLFIAYLGAFFGTIIFFTIMGNIGWELFVYYDEELGEALTNITIPEPLAVVLYCMIPVTFYALAYLVLRRRQVKW